MNWIFDQPGILFGEGLQIVGPSHRSLLYDLITFGLFAVDFILNGQLYGRGQTQAFNTASSLTSS
jgi:hypothetical protein